MATGSYMTPIYSRSQKFILRTPNIAIKFSIMSTPKTKIFVGHLPDLCTDDDLRALFEKYGVVTECDVINKYGFVHMATPEQANEAVKHLNNYNLMGSTISVELSATESSVKIGAAVSEISWNK
ncbi:RRM domain-containing protein [Trichonephila clavipes]|nr:RRM domain-containing protein [Trichonephila clavipes]